MKNDRLDELAAERLAIDQAVRRFISCFEGVFHEDWDFTAEAIGSQNLIARDGTFLEPGVGDESNNWGNRGSLLASYREMKSLLATKP